MASIYELKPAFQNLLRPLTRRLANAGVSANQVTVVACLMSLATALLIALHASDPGGLKILFAVPAILFVRMALNAIDGMLAREHGLQSRLGGILNELTDVISDSALFLAYAYVPDVRVELVVAVAILGVISEMTGVVAVTIGATRRYDGPMGKSDRAFAFGLLALLLASGVPGGTWIDYFLGAVIALLCFTIVNRSRRALGEAK